jgi:hypothetical protein
MEIHQGRETPAPIRLVLLNIPTVSRSVIILTLGRLPAPTTTSYLYHREKVCRKIEQC